MLRDHTRESVIFVIRYYTAHYPHIVLSMLAGIVYVDGLLLGLQPLCHSMLSLVLLFAVCSSIGTVKLFYSYWVIGHRKTQRLCKRILKRCTFRATDSCRLHALKRILAACVKTLQPSSGSASSWWYSIFFYPTLFLIGIVPKPGFRTIGLLACRKRNSLSGFCFLAFGNIVRFALLQWLLAYIMRTVHCQHLFFTHRAP